MIGPSIMLLDGERSTTTGYHPRLQEAARHSPARHAATDDHDLSWTPVSCQSRGG